MDRADLPPLSIHTGGTSVRTPALHGRTHRVGARPGIGHLLVWMAGCAGYLAAMRMLAEDPISLRGSLYLVAHCLGQGAALGATGWYLVNRLRGRQRALEPGEWLMVAVAARLLAQVAFYRGHAAGPELVLCSSTSRLPIGFKNDAKSPHRVLLWRSRYKHEARASGSSESTRSRFVLVWVRRSGKT